MSATRGVGTVYPSEQYEFTPVFSGAHVFQSVDFYVV